MSQIDMPKTGFEAFFNGKETERAAADALYRYLLKARVKASYTWMPGGEIKVQGHNLGLDDSALGAVSAEARSELDDLYAENRKSYSSRSAQDATSSRANEEPFDPLYAKILEEHLSGIAQKYLSGARK